MPASPEIEPKLPIIEHPEVPEIPKSVESVTGVRVVPANVTAQVKDEKGQNLIQTPVSPSIQITIPRTQEALTTISKGNIGDAVTWFGRFWLRMIKKAVRVGWGWKVQENP